MQRKTDYRESIERASGGYGVEEAEGGNAWSLGLTEQGIARQHGHSYGSAVVGGRAQAHFGDSTINHHYYSEHQSQDDKYKTLLKSLMFAQMEARLRNVAIALPTTCEWLFRHWQFSAWTNDNKISEHHGFLWIKGKPGSGKSTIMKKAVAWAERTWRTNIILSYFFNARAPGELEKSSLGLYRSLLHQLLTMYDGVRPLFISKFSSKERNGQVENWTEIELQNFFVEVVTTKRLPPLAIFVDALDEGQEDDIRRMVTFFEEIGEHAISSDTLLRICLSSRHYPRISIQNGLFIVIEEQWEHGRDIELYIHTKLRGSKNQSVDGLRKTLLQKSASIFLWVVLVVPMLNQIHDRGQGSAAMMRELESVPKSLHDLFAEILTRNTDNIDECVTLLRWVLSSMRPLTSIELYLAIQQGQAPLDIDKLTIVEDELVAKYLLDRSRGLVNLTKERPSTVQFIHETVRDSLKATNLLTSRQGNLYDPYFAELDFQADTCHLAIAEDCLHYLLHVCEKAPLPQEVFDQHPLAGYAAEYWWQHMQAANSACSQRALNLALNLLTDSAHLLVWVQLYNLDNPLQSLDLSLGVGDLGPPIYYVALAGLQELVRRLLLLEGDVNAQGGHYGNALQAASAKGHDPVVQMLLDAGADVNAQGGHYSNALQAASLHGHGKVVQMLLNAGADVNTQEGLYGNALQAASYGAYEEVVRTLLDAGADVNTQGGLYGNALQAASYDASEKVVRILLDAGADVNAQGGLYGNALQVASLHGHGKVVQMLLDAGADVNAQGGLYGNALQAASYGAYEKVVRTLLDAGADVNAQGGEYGHALQVALLHGHKKVVQILLDAGAALNTHWVGRGNAIHAATYGNYRTAVQILLNTAANMLLYVCGLQRIFRRRTS